MLQIYVFGDKESGFLDLDETTVLDMESLSDMFDEDLSTGEFSIPLEAPWTDRNRRLLSFAERLENGGANLLWWRCMVYDGMFPEIPAGKITLLEKAGLFTYKKGKFSFTISGSKGLYGSLIKNKKLADLQLGGPITWSADESRVFARDVMMGVYPQYEHIAFAPVAIEDFVDKNRPDFVSEFLAKDTVNNIVITGAGANSWLFGRPKPTDPTQVTSPGDNEHLDYRTVPFLSKKYVLKKCFEEFGFSVAGALIDTDDLEGAYMFNNYGIENYANNIAEDFNRTILPGNHVPDMYVSEFLKALLSAFNVYPVFETETQVRLKFREDAIKQRSIYSINEICSDEFSSNFTLEDPKSGYKLDYVWDSNDSFYSDRVKDLKDKIIAGTVARFSDLATFDPGYALTTDHIVFVEADNMYFRVANATVSPLLWDAYSERLDGYTKGNGERTVDCNISTLCTYVEYDATDALYERRNYLGCRQKGSYMNEKGVRVLNPFGLRIFFIEMRNISGVIIPVSYNYYRNAANEIIRENSLCWQGENGLADKYHTSWQDLRERSELVKTDIRVDQKINYELKQHNCYEVNSVQFIPYRFYRTIPLKNKINVEMIPL
jgi:hypothetical protein